MNLTSPMFRVTKRTLHHAASAWPALLIAALFLIPARISHAVDRPTVEYPDLDWVSSDSVVYPIRVWSVDRPDNALRALQLIHDNAMYEKFQELLDVRPLSDINHKPENGGDGRLDIYIYAVQGGTSFAGSIAVAKTWNPRKASCWIRVSDDLKGDALIGALAHELFHAFQWAIDWREQQWWEEATAVWAEDVIKHDLKPGEREYIKEAFDVGVSSQNVLTLANGSSEYGMFLFPAYLSHRFGDQKVGDIWQACEDLDALTAIDNEVRRGSNGEMGFDECFKEYCLFNSDIGPRKDSYVDADGPYEIYKFHKERPRELDADKPPTEPIMLFPLSAVFYRFENAIKNPESTPSVRFDLADFAANDKLTVQAIIDPDGDAREEDWSDRKERTFCLNEEDFDSIALVIASSERPSVSDGVFSIPVLKVEIGPGECAEGDARARITNTYTLSHFSEDSWSKLEMKGTIDATFELEESLYSRADPPDVPAELTEFYAVKSWNISSFQARWTSYSRSEGKNEARGVNVHKDPDADVDLTIDIDPETGKAHRASVGDVNVLFDWDTMPMAAGSPASFSVNNVISEEVESGDGVRSLQGSGEMEGEPSKHKGFTERFTTNWQVWRHKPDK